jgi:rhodanese-related sulfurtransferase
MEQFSQFIINHWYLCLAFLVVLTLVLINEALTQKKKTAELSPQAAVDMINNQETIIIDLRDKDSFNKGHIIDSVSLGESELTEPKLTKFKNKSLILVCARGLQSQTCAAKLRAEGYSTFVLSGGISAWVNAELPLLKAKK